MEIKHKIAHALATAAAFAFVTAPLTSAVVEAKEKTIFCYGVNTCKGKSECATAEATCKGENTCKGKGYLYMTATQCKNAGGAVKVPPLNINISG